MKCELCDERAAKVKVAKTGKLACPECFVFWFEEVSVCKCLQCSVFRTCTPPS